MSALEPNDSSTKNISKLADLEKTQYQRETSALTSVATKPTLNARLRPLKFSARKCTARSAISRTPMSRGLMRQTTRTTSSSNSNTKTVGL